MADLKISALPASTTPLAGTEVLPIVQSSTTKQVSVANLTAGRTFEALGVTLTSTDAGATAAPLLDLYRDSASPAASDTLGEIEFNGEDSAGNKQTYGVIHGSILSPTSTAEQGQLHFETATAGALTEKMIIGTTNLVVNEIGGVFNVRIEGDTDANLFYTDATNDKVGIGTTSPAQKLTVSGSANITGSVGIGATAPAAALAFSKGDGETNGIVIGHPNWPNTYYAGIYGTVTNGASNTQGILRVGTRVNATDATLTNIGRFNANGDFQLDIGNLVIGTSGKGIDFSATAGTGTSELLADYEEGTWTPVVTPVSGSITTQSCTGSYVKVGNQVTVTFDITISNVGTGTTLDYIAGLPFTTANTAQQGSSAARERSATGLPWVFQTGQNQTRINGWSSANSQTIANYAWQGSVTYLTA